jgi:hypothetical protein
MLEHKYFNRKGLGHATHTATAFRKLAVWQPSRSNGP